MKVSVCILTFNEVGNLAAAVASARQCPWCDQVVVMDSGSNDGTVELAGRIADVVEHQPWIDFSTNRQLLVSKARNDWVFILDADEVISPQLGAEIAALSEADWRNCSIFTMPRKNYLFRRHVRAWDPDRVDRLFDRTRVRWPRRSVHDVREAVSGKTGRLRAPLLHRPGVDAWSDYFDGQRFDSRTDALAREMRERGKHARASDLWVRPAMTFVKFYLLKGSWRQGTFGLLVARKASFSVALKYTRLWHLEHSGSEPPPAPKMCILPLDQHPIPR